MGATDVKIHVEGKEFHLGYSRVSCYETCPRKYKHSYIDGIRTPGGVAMRRGQAYHNTLDVLLNHKKDTEELLPIEKAERVAIRAAKAENLTPSEIYRVIDAVRFWHSESYPDHFPVAVEQDFVIHRGGVKLTGRLDEAQVTGKIVDHKFSYDRWADVRAKYGCQPIIYQWAGLDYLPKKLKNWHYTGFSYQIIRLFPTPLIQEITIDPIPQWESDWYEEQIAQIAASIQAGLFPARPSDKECGWCGHKALCKPAIWDIRKDETETEVSGDGIDEFEDC